MALDDDHDWQWYALESSYLLNELARLGYHRSHDRRTAAYNHDTTTTTAMASSRPHTADTTSSVAINGYGNAASTATATAAEASVRLEQQKRALREQWRTIHEDRVLTRLHHARSLQSSLPSTVYNDDDIFGVGIRPLHDHSGSQQLFNESLRYATQSLRIDEPCIHVAVRSHQLHNMVHEARASHRDPFTAIIKSIEEQRRDWAAVQAAMAARVATITFMMPPSLSSSSGMSGSSRVVWDGLEDGTSSTPFVTKTIATINGAAAAAAAGGTYGRIAELKRHHACCIIQRYVRRWLHQRHVRWFTQRRVRLHRHLTKQLAHRAYVDSVRALQACISVYHARQHMRSSRLVQMRRYHTAIRIWRWYRYRRALRRSYARWQSRGDTRLRNEARWWTTHVNDIIMVQSVIRRWRANRVADWRDAFQLHRDRRRADRIWLLERAQLIAVADVERELVHGSMMVAQEVARCDAEMAHETKKFDVKWKKWERSLHDHFLRQKPLPKLWLPQLDRRTGGTYFINLTTGVTQHEHPFAADMETVRAQERAKGESQLQERLSRIMDYKQRIIVGDEQSRARLMTRWDDEATRCYHRNAHLLAVHSAASSVSSVASVASSSTQPVAKVASNSNNTRRVPVSSTTASGIPTRTMEKKKSNKLVSAAPVPVPSTLIMGARIPPVSPSTPSSATATGRPILSMGLRFPSSSMASSPSAAATATSSSSASVTIARSSAAAAGPTTASSSSRYASIPVSSWSNNMVASPDSPVRPGESYAI